MSKTLLKISSVSLLVIALLVGSSFTVSAATIISYVRIPFYRTNWTQWFFADQETYVSDIDISLDLSPLELMLDDNHDENYGAEDGNVDFSYPSYIVMSSNNYTNVQQLSRSLRAFNLEELTSLTAVNNLGTNDIWVNIIDIMLGTSSSYTYSGASINFGTLYDMGYRLYKKSSVSYGNTTYYVYKLNRFKAADSITFEGYTDVDVDVFHSNNSQYLYATFFRWDFNVTDLYKQGESNLTFDEGDYFKFVGVPQPQADFFTYYDIYETHDCNLVEVDTSGNTFYINITGRNPYITWMNTANSGYIDASTRVKGNVNADLYKGAGADMTGINNKLTEIIDLLSDMQVEEINNYYIDLSSEWNIDIDEEINLHLGDFNVNVNDLPISDPKYTNNTTDFQKVGSFKIIFSNMMKTMDDSGIAVLYFLPFILLVLGAVL